MEETRAVKEYSDQGKGSVPDMETGCCLGSEGNGVRAGERGEGGPWPPEKEKVKQLMPSKNGDNMEKDEEEQSNWA